MGRNLIETVMGAVVLIVAGGFLVFAYKQSAVKSIDGYNVRAEFSDISGVGVGSEVRIGGMKVGVVDSLKLNPETYQAYAVLEIKDAVKLPKDTSAAIVSSGLLGDKFIKLDPGGSDDYLENDGVIKFTQSSVSFEDLIGKFVFSGGGVDEKRDEPSAEPAPQTSTPDDADESKETESPNPFSLGF